MKHLIDEGQDRLWMTTRELCGLLMAQDPEGTRRVSLKTEDGDILDVVSVEYNPKTPVYILGE